MGIPGQSSDWHTTGLPRDVISLIVDVCVCGGEGKGIKKIGRYWLRNQALCFSVFGACAYGAWYPLVGRCAVKETLIQGCNSH